jgi:uncharacterized membrane protein
MSEPLPSPLPLPESAPPPPAGKPASGQRFDPVYVNAMSHFYRGELGRIMVWRQRLDVTTSWAITLSSAVFGFAFADARVPHIIFFFNVMVVWMLLWIEARRYRFYDAFRARVRMLEAHFLVPIVSQNTAMLHGEWQRLVCQDLLLPSFKISRLEAIGRRLRRNYAFVFLIVLVAWTTKIFLHADPKINSLETFYDALHVGTSIPSWLVAGVFVFTVSAVAIIIAYASKKSSGEISEFGTHRSLWRF